MAKSPTAVCALPECNQPTVADSRYCSARHNERDVFRKLTRPLCPQCRKKFERGAGAGRPAIYCSAACKSARERAIARATRDLARDSMKGDPRELLRDAELLRSWWYPPVTGTYSRYAEELEERFWPRGSRPAATTAPPDQRVRRALMERINRLRELVRQEEQREQEAAAQAERKRQEQERVKQEQAEQEQDRAWRRQLIGGDGDAA